MTLTTKSNNARNFLLKKLVSLVDSRTRLKTIPKEQACKVFHLCSNVCKMFRFLLIRFRAGSAQLESAWATFAVGKIKLVFRWDTLDCFVTRLQQERKNYACHRNRSSELRLVLEMALLCTVAVPRWVKLDVGWTALIQLQLDLIGSVNKLKSSECLCMKREMDNSCQQSSKIGQENATHF